MDEDQGGGHDDADDGQPQPPPQFAGQGIPDPYRASLDDLTTRLGRFALALPIHWFFIRFCIRTRRQKSTIRQQRPQPSGPVGFMRSTSRSIFEECQTAG